jgi:hypothetical protein
VSNDNIAIINFIEGWEQDGVGVDGLPMFRPVVKIRKSVPPLTEVEYVATEEDFAEFPLPYQRFLKEQGSRRPEVEGYPLALWPVISPSDFKVLAARDIVTVEQLAKIADRRDTSTVPAPIVELAKRAKQMIELQGQVGKFEALITDLVSQRDQIAADLKEANATITAQNSLINNMRGAMSGKAA